MLEKEAGKHTTNVQHFQKVGRKKVSHYFFSRGISVMGTKQQGPRQSDLSDSSIRA